MIIHPPPFRLITGQTHLTEMQIEPREAIILVALLVAELRKEMSGEEIAREVGLI